jgi:hypothetical protein
MRRLLLWIAFLGALGCAKADLEGCVGAPDGLPCDDGDLCTEDDACIAGLCKGNVLDCSILDGQCQQGFCDSATGECIKQDFEDTPCEDGDLCTTGEVCSNGICGGGTPKVCVSDNSCEDGICDAETGDCLSKPVDDGTACNDGNVCFSNGVCEAFPDNTGSECVATPLACTLPNGISGQCAQSQCNPADLDGNPCQVVFLNEGQACNDGNAGTVGETCNQGVCTAGAAVCTDDGFEANNNLATATNFQPGALGLGSPVNGKLTVCDANQDFFALRTPIAGEVLAMEVHNAFGGCGFDSLLQLKTNDGTALGTTVLSDADSGEGTCPAIGAIANYPSLPAGAVFPVVTSDLSGGTGDYILEIDPINHDADGFEISTLSHEPNATKEGADRADFAAGPYRGEVTSNTDVDFARFTVFNRTKIFATLTDGNGGCPFDARLEILNNDAQPLNPAIVASAGQANGCPQLDMLLNNQGELLPGSFLIKISNENGGLGSYQVDVLFEAVEHEPNNNSAQAEGNMNSGSVEGAISAAGDIDVYKFVLKDPGITGAIGAPGTILALTAGPQGGACVTDTILELRAADGVTVLATDDDSGNGNCSFLSTATPGVSDLVPGTYFLFVRGFSNATGAYRLNFAVAHDQESEPNSTRATADAMRLVGGFGSREGRLTMFSTDLYSVVVPNGGDLKVETSDGAGGCATDTVVQIRGTSGLSTEVLATNDDGGTGNCSLATATNLPAGTYFVAVLPFIGTTNPTCLESCDGPYTVSVQVVP